MRAFAMTGFDETPSVIDLPIPQPGQNEVQVQVLASSVNGIDLATAGGMLQGMMEYQFPFILGKDFAGTVTAAGANVDGYAIGDRVFGVVMDPSMLHTRSYSEFLTVPAVPNMVHIPASVSFEIAGVLGLAGAAAIGAIEAVQLASGESVLISGATGGAGSLAIQLAKRRGATVLATAKPGAAIEFVLELGADQVIDYTANVSEQVRAILPGGLDAVIHLAGDATELAALLVPGGRFVSTLGVGQDAFPGMDIVATPVIANPDIATLASLANGVVSGSLRVPIQKTYRLDQIGEAFADFGTGTRGKLAIEVSH